MEKERKGLLDEVEEIAKRRKEKPTSKDKPAKRDLDLDSVWD